MDKRMRIEEVREILLEMKELSTEIKIEDVKQEDLDYLLTLTILAFEAIVERLEEDSNG